MGLQRGIRNAGVIRGEHLFGIAFGFDFCAEHECGIKPMREFLGMDTSKIGLDGRTISNHSTIIYKEDTANDKALITLANKYDFKSENEKTFEQLLPVRYYNYPDMDKVESFWKEDRFTVIGNLSIIKEMYDAFLKNDIVLAGLNHEQCKAHPAFDQKASLTILIKSRIPEPIVTNFFYEDKKDLDLYDYEHKIGLTKLKEDAQEKYSEGDHDNGKTWMALSPRWVNYNNEDPEAIKGKTEYNIMYWANYPDGDDSGYGWYTVEQVKEWLTTPGVTLRSVKEKYQTETTEE